MKRVVVITLCLLVGIAVGRVLRDGSVARAETDREGLDAGQERADAGSRGSSPTRLPAKRLARVDGRLVLPTEWSPATIDVRLGALDPDWKPSLFPRLPRLSRAERSGEYRFEFAGVRPGSYRLAAAIDGRVASVHTSIEVLDKTVEHIFKLELPPHDGFGKVRVLGPDGEDAGPLQCTLSIRGPEGSMAMAGGTRSLRGGLYLVKHPERFPESFDTASLHLKSERFGELTVPYDPREDKPPVLRFREPARLTITIAGYAASPHKPFIQVRIRTAGSNKRPRQPSRSGIDEAGVLDLRAVQPGDKEILLGTVCDRLFCPIAQTTVTVASSETRAQLTIPVLYELRIVRTRSDVESIGVRLIQGSPLTSYRLVRLTADETAVERLVPGTYELTGHSDGKDWEKTIRVPDHSTVHVP